MKKIKFLIFLIFPLFGFKCITNKMRENFIQVENLLPFNLYCVPSYAYPDTTLVFTNKERILANDSIYFINALGVKKLFYTDLCNEASWNRLIKGDSLQIFVFDEQVVKHQNWNDVILNKRYLRRLTYGYKDLLTSKCKILVR